MKYFFLIGLFFLSACHLNEKLVNLDEGSIVKMRSSNIVLKDEDFKKMTFDEFSLFLEMYSKNSNYPNIDN